MTNQPLVKKTKSEILEAYQQLLSRFDEAKRLAQNTNASENNALVEAAKTHSTETILKEMGDLKIKTHNHFDTLAEQLLGAARTFTQLQEAAAIAESNLKNTHHLQIAADALEQLVQDYEKKQKELESGHQQKLSELNQAIEIKKRDWQREAEEYAYGTKLQHKREKELFEEEMAKQHKILTEREQNIANQETEIQKLKVETTNFGQRLAVEIARSRQELTQSLEQEFANRLALINKDRENEQKMAQLKTAHLEESVKKQAQEIGQLHAETEKVHAQSQTIALKLIENPPFSKKGPVELDAWPRNGNP